MQDDHTGSCTGARRSDLYGTSAPARWRHTWESKNMRDAFILKSGHKEV